jgi:hypothetical protein
LLGGLLSIGGVVVAEFLRDDVLTPRELEALNIGPVLASVPKLRPAARRLKREPEIVSEEIPDAPTRFEPAIQPRFAQQPRLVQPKVSHDPVLEWAAGE